MIEFFQTVMGKKFYESDVPRIAKALERIASALETRAPEKPKPPPAPEKKCGENICCDDPECPSRRAREAHRCDDPDCADGKFGFRARAIAQHHRDGELEIDPDAEVSVSMDGDTVRGAYVQAWVWVDADQKGVG